MGNLTIPKHSADLDECMKALQVYYEQKPNWLTNHEYVERLKNLLGSNLDPSSYTKKSQVPAYYGFIEWEDLRNKRSARRITEHGIRFYEAHLKMDRELQQALIVKSLESITYGRNNYGSFTSDSDVEPPCLIIRAILDLGNISVQEFAALLCFLADHRLGYEQGLKLIKDARGNGLPIEVDGIKRDYLDPKGITILKRWNILIDLGTDINRSLLLGLSFDFEVKYKSRLLKLKVFNTEIAEMASQIKGVIYDEINSDDLDLIIHYLGDRFDEADEIYGNQDLIDSLNNRNPVLIQYKYGSRFEIDSRISKLAIKINGEVCSSNNSHDLFDKGNGYKYLEGHHLIPMSAQKDFAKNIDRIENIVGLCPYCHRAIHHGSQTVKRTIIKTIFTTEKVEMLNSLGLIFNIEELISKYY